MKVTCHDGVGGHDEEEEEERGRASFEKHFESKLHKVQTH